MRDIIELAKKDGSYQDVEINGEKVLSGWRSCDDRWEIIKPHISGGQVIADIGSHFGFFTAKIARELPTSLVWSFEPEELRSEVQARMLTANKLENVLLSKHAIQLHDLVKLVSSCEALDTIICLSTIHYFPPEEIKEILWLFGQLAHTLIMEFPSPKETDVAEKDNVARFSDPANLLARAFDSVEKLGETPSPKHPEVMRPIFLAKNNRVNRNHCLSHMNSLNHRKHKISYDQDRNFKWWIDSFPMAIRGINLANYIKFNPVYRVEDDLLLLAAKEYHRLIKKLDGNVTDIHPANLVITADGISPIDYSENIGQPLYGLPDFESYRQKLLKYDEGMIFRGLKERSRCV